MYNCISHSSHFFLLSPMSQNNPTSKANTSTPCLSPYFVPSIIPLFDRISFLPDFGSFLLLLFPILYRLTSESSYLKKEKQMLASSNPSLLFLQPRPPFLVSLALTAQPLSSQLKGFTTQPCFFLDSLYSLVICWKVLSTSRVNPLQYRPIDLPKEDVSYVNL